jgi:hypothetical protein
MASKNSTIAWVTVPDIKAANQVVRTLTENGFARNSINISGNAKGQMDVKISTSEANLPLVEKLIHPSNPLYAVRHATAGVTKTLASSPVITVGAAALVGYALFKVFKTRLSVSSLSELPRTIRDLPVRDWVDDVQDTAANMADTVQERVRDAMAAVPDSIAGPAATAAEAVVSAAKSVSDQVSNLGGQQSQPGGQGSQSTGEQAKPAHNTPMTPESQSKPQTPPVGSPTTSPASAQKPPEANKAPNS